MTLKELAANPAKYIGKQLTVTGNGSDAGKYRIRAFYDYGSVVSIDLSDSPSFPLGGDTRVTLTENGFKIKGDPYSFVCE
jgi:hypothetical protein